MKNKFKIGLWIIVIIIIILIALLLVYYFSNLSLRNQKNLNGNGGQLGTEGPFSTQEIVCNNVGNWTLHNNSGSRNWRSIASSANGTKLAAVEYNGYIYTSNDSGTTWLQRAFPGNWTSIASSGDGTKLAAGTSPGYIYMSSDSGVTWTPRMIFGLNNWYSIASSTDGIKLAAVNYFSYIYTSNNSGVTWIRRTNSGLRPWTSIASSADGMKLAAVLGSNGSVYISNNFGVNWTQVDCASSSSWHSIASSANGTRLVVTDYNGYIYTSSNSGVNWTQRRGAGIGPWESVSSSSDGSKLAAVGGYGNTTQYIYLSNDSGATWAQQTSVGSRIWYSVASSADGTKLAVVDNGGYIYTYNQSLHCTSTQCNQNSDCGNDSIGGLFCLGLGVYQNYTNYICNNPGTTSSYCSNTTISRFVKACSQSNEQCKQTTCVSGVCGIENRPNGAGCNDNNSCTGVDICTNGTCAGTPIVPTPPSCSCTSEDTCPQPPKTEQCKQATCIGNACGIGNKADGTICNDSDICTLNDQCNSGVCSGTDKTCTPTSECKMSNCDESTGDCVETNKPDGTNCTIATGFGTLSPFLLFLRSFGINLGLEATLNGFCSNGICINSCVNLCTSSGDKRCSGNFSEICGDYNSDGCLEWGGDLDCTLGCDDSSGVCISNNSTINITSVSSSVTTDSATINWVTDADSNSLVNYGTDINNLIDYAYDDDMVMNHAVTFSGLLSSTTYYYNLTSCDNSGNCATSGANSFTTNTINPPTGGGGGGGGGLVVPKKCSENWVCGNWSQCINGKTSRICLDKNKCNTTKNKPAVSVECSISSTNKTINNNQSQVEKPIPKEGGSIVLVNYLKVASVIFIIVIVTVLLIKYFKNNKFRKKIKKVRNKGKFKKRRIKRKNSLIKR